MVPVNFYRQVMTMVLKQRYIKGASKVWKAYSVFVMFGGRYFRSLSTQHFESKNQTKHVGSYRKSHSIRFISKESQNPLQ